MQIRSLRIIGQIEKKIWLENFFWKKLAIKIVTMETITGKITKIIHHDSLFALTHVYFIFSESFSSIH